MVASPSQPDQTQKYWPSARHFTEAIQCPSVCFSNTVLRNTLPAVDRLGMPLVTSGQFAYVYKLKSMNGDGDFAVRCFRGYLRDRDQRYGVIQEHVRSSSVSFLSDFSYLPEGIMVGGKRFPILFMKWIEGPTLDLYLGQMLNRREVLLHLANEWLRVVGALQASGIAHGDLQHGNIIVEHGRLRLVDHDGIFVTAMKGWSACEVGHQHYQHPQRHAHHFDLNLDNFSSLTIYLSLLSLAERPRLWQEHHDENLLFTQADFLDPASSSLFAKIRELGAEHRRLADVLASAASGPPTSVPRLLDLVHTTSSLPFWMNAPIDLDAKTKTREVVQTDAQSEKRPVRWKPWQNKNKTISVPATPASSTVQTIFGASATPASSRIQTIFGAPAPVPTIRDPDNVVKNTLVFGKEFLRKHFLLWYWSAYILLSFTGLSVAFRFFAALFCVAIGCLIYGLSKARDEGRSAPSQVLPVGSPPIKPQSGPGSWHPLTHPQPLLTGANPIEPIVGNRVLGIYHLQACKWVDQISAANRVSFASASEALSHGFKPCRICIGKP